MIEDRNELISVGKFHRIYFVREKDLILKLERSYIELIPIITDIKI